MYKIVYFDTETTGLPSEGQGIEAQPHLLSASVVVDHYNGKTREFTPVEEYEVYNKDAGAYLTEEGMKINGITLEELNEKGLTQSEVHQRLLESFKDADVIICHNTKFDMQILWYEALRSRNQELVSFILNVRNFCTSINSRSYTFNNKGGKHMKLIEVFETLNGYQFDGAHNALADTLALRNIVQKMIHSGELKPNVLTDEPKYSYINIKVEDGKFISDISKISIKTLHPIITRTAVNTSVDEMLGEVFKFIDDSVIFFFSNKESLEDFNRMVAGTNIRSTFGFRLASHISLENKVDSMEMINIHKSNHQRKFVNGFTLLKDNGIFYR